MNRGQIRNAARELALVTNPKQISDGQLNVWIRQATSELSDTVDGPWQHATGTITTADGTATYVLPKTFQNMIKVFKRVTNVYHRPLVGMSQAMFYESFGSDVSYPKRADAEYYTLRNVAGVPNIVLYPKPNGVYTYSIHYNKKQAAYTSDTDVPEIPEQFHWGIVEGVLAKLYYREEMFEPAALAQVRFDDYKRLMRQYAHAWLRDFPHVYGDGFRYYRNQDPNIPSLPGPV